MQRTEQCGKPYECRCLYVRDEDASKIRQLMNPDLLSTEVPYDFKDVDDVQENSNSNRTKDIYCHDVAS